MSVFTFFSKLVSKQSPPAPAKAVPAGPVAPVPWTPRPEPRTGRQQPQRTRQASPPPPVKAQPSAAKTPPPVVPVGARGETDLAPSRAKLDGVKFPSVEESGTDLDRVAIRELFSDIASSQAEPVKSFIGDLRARNATGEWLQVCRPVMALLLESATSLGLDDAVPPMSAFISALDLAAESQEGVGGPIDGAARDAILKAYASLAKVFPGVFALGETSAQRNPMLLHALLKQAPGVGVVTFDALYGVGLSSIEALSHASPEELSATTGISMSLCESICGLLREHQLEVDRRAIVPGERWFSDRLLELLRALVLQHDAFERAAGGVGVNDVRVERKRAARRNRDLCALRIEATLIEMGAVDCADALRVLSFDRRIEHLEKFLGVRVAKRASEQR